MATIYKRETSKGKSYRVQFRRKGFPTYSATFFDKKEAEKFAKDYEKNVINEIPIPLDRLRKRRENEFNRKGIRL
jgi:hypothetical protein